MRKHFLCAFVFCLILTFALPGYGAKKAASGQEAIEQSITLATAQKKAAYLIQQAKAFYNLKDFQGTIAIAQYILTNVDKASQEAKNLLQKAKDTLEAIARQNADKLKEQFGREKK